MNVVVEERKKKVGDTRSCLNREADHSKKVHFGLFAKYLKDFKVNLKRLGRVDGRLKITVI